MLQVTPSQALDCVVVVVVVVVVEVVVVVGASVGGSVGGSTVISGSLSEQVPSALITPEQHSRASVLNVHLYGNVPQQSNSLFPELVIGTHDAA